MKRTLFALTTVALSSVAISASAQLGPAPAPNTTLLMGNDMFETGQSNNIGPAINQVIDNHWTDGACTAVNGWATCDALRFGMTMYADAFEAPDTECTDSINILLSPQEDGGETIDGIANGIHNDGGDEWCDDMEFRPHDSGLELHHAATFENTFDPTDAELDAYWERPHLTLQFIGALPQTSDTAPANRTIDAIRAACDNYDGQGGILPSMPTWTFLTKKFDDEAAPFAGLVAAGGGTAACCYGAGCDPIDDEIDVCDHVNDGRLDADVRDDIIDGEYSCGPDGTTAGIGLADFGGENQGQLKDIRCHLVGDDNNDNCDPGTETDILGLFACIRQLPRGVSADDVDIQVCYEDGVPASVDSFSLGPDHTCVVLLDGTAQCWGKNSGGKLGDGTETDRTSPTGVGGGLDFAAISASKDQTCGVTTDKDVYCWGQESDCSFGDDNNDDKYLEPTEITDNIASRATTVEVGTTTACALIDDGTVLCWGDDSNGQLGNGNPKSTTCGADEVKNLDSVVQLSLGVEYGCAVRSDGEGVCWGYNSSGQLGDGSSNTRTAPVTVEGSHVSSKIATGYDHTCGVDTDGIAWCWGTGGDGQIGDGTTNDYDEPQEVDTLTDVTDISVGETFSCAVNGSGEVWCWGDNGSGQVTGDSGDGNSNQPVQVDEISDAIAVRAGKDHTCALISNGDLICWGLGHDIDDVFVSNVDTTGMGGGGGGDSDLTCELLTEAGGGIQWIDENQTLFVVTDVDKCDQINIINCEPNLPCDTGLIGRCAFGRTDCTTGEEVCVPAFEIFPEICNGLDDDCDGLIDNMNESWTARGDGYALPTDHLGLDCNREDVCMCPDGVVDTHIGGDWEAYLDGWTGACTCGEGLGPATDFPDDGSKEAEPSAGCASATADGALPTGMAVLFLGFVGGRIRRRKR